MNIYEIEASRIWTKGLRDALHLRSPHEQAAAAHWAGGPSVDELEQQVIAYRARILGPATA